VQKYASCNKLFEKTHGYSAVGPTSVESVSDAQKLSDRGDCGKSHTNATRHSDGGAAMVITCTGTMASEYIAARSATICLIMQVM
jgi:hypothetical protein